MSFTTPLRRSATSALRRGTKISGKTCTSQNQFIHPSSSRNTSTSSTTEESSTGSIYPYSSSVITRSHRSSAETSSAVPSSSSSPIDSQITTLKSGKERKDRGIMVSLNEQLRKQYDPTGSFTSLFSRNSSDRIPPGSIVVVETWNDAKKVTFSSFSGVLMAIRRRNTSTSIVLRNLVNKTGVEQRFNIYSPLLKEIKIVQRAIGTKRDSRLRRTRRAKLYYLRKDDSRLPNIARAIQNMRLREQNLDQNVSNKAKGNNDVDGKKRK